MHPLYCLTAGCDDAWMKIGKKKTKMFHLSRTSRHVRSEISGKSFEALFAKAPFGKESPI